jgi:hypothetical protein
MKIYLDFDGTCVEHKYPEIGAYNPGCFEVIKKLQKAGHDITLNTYRVEISEDSLREALEYLNKNTEHLIAPIMQCTTKKLQPFPWMWGTIEKLNEMCIDDSALGIPLITTPDESSMMVDWDALDKQFEEHGIYEKTF